VTITVSFLPKKNLSKNLSYPVTLWLFPKKNPLAALTLWLFLHRRRRGVEERSW
jgi:hypothetical protein